MRIAVVGAGWAGLTAAIELTAAGHPVELFEAGRVAGGRARSVTLDGRLLDNGQHILLGAYRDTLAMMRHVGANPDTLLDRRPLAVIDPAGFRMQLPTLPAPFNVAWGLLSASPIRWREKLATARWMQSVKWRQFQVDPDCTVAQWLDAAGQTGPLRQQLWEPLCLAAMNTPAERASAQVFSNVLRDSLGSHHRDATDLLLPRVPLGELFPEPALRWLQARGCQIRFRHRVRRLSTDETGVAIDGERFDSAVLALSPRHLAQCLPEVDVPTAFEPIATVYLQYPEKTRLPFPLIKLSKNVGQWVVDRGQGMLGCALSGHGDWEALDDAVLVHALHAELGLTEPLLWHGVIREQRATHACLPGSRRRLPCSPSPRLALAGDCCYPEYPATLEAAVRSGKIAAARLMASAPHSAPTPA